VRRTATARDGRGASGRRPDPERSTEFAHLSLAALRAHRDDLTAEETRVSYWRRLVQARLDVLSAESTRVRAAGADPHQLRELLTDRTTTRRHRAVVAVLPGDDVPPLPDLAALWAELCTDDDDARATLVARLRGIELELSAYRSALHGRIDRSTAELIARYREDPASCLVALPLRRP
jgi:anti-sigma-K factor RsiG